MMGALRTRSWFFVLLVFMLLMFVSNTYGSLDLNDTFYCDCSGGTVKIGDTKDEVLNKCDEPTNKTNRGGEKWIYDFGSSEFVRHITFIDDKVHRIQTGGYGGP